MAHSPMSDRAAFQNGILATHDRVTSGSVKEVVLAPLDYFVLFQA